MPLVLQLAKLSRRLAMAGCAGASVAGALTVAGCRDLPPLLPIEPPGDTVVPVDPSDPGFGRSVHFVATNGTPANSGDSVAPWDLRTALSGASGRVTPGDTVWIRGGTYHGAFISRVAGAAGAPVVIRAWPGERAILEHSGGSATTLTVQGPWTTVWGLEITNDDPDRYHTSTASELRPSGVVNDASHTRFINLVVHDAGVGFYNYPQFRDVEVYGSIFYNNGWQAPDRGHGHAFYVKSDVGPVILRENVAFNQFGWGIHVYSDRGSGGLNGVTIDRNITFGNGSVASGPSGQNILLGGENASTGSSVTGNVAWFPTNRDATNLRVGYGAVQNGSVDVRDNVVIGGSPVLRVGRWSTATFSSNVLAGSARMVQLDGGSLGGYSWSGTRQVRDPLSFSWLSDGTARPFLLWTTLTGLGISDIVGAVAPTAPNVLVWPNTHETGRAFIAVMNWTRASSIPVDLSSVLATGDGYEIRNVQALFGAPVLSGTYTGPVNLPTTGVAPPIPIGLSSSAASRTGPDFDVFLVLRR